MKDARSLEALAGVRLNWDTSEEEGAGACAPDRRDPERLLYRGADVLILDEPTAVLAPAQVKELIALLRKLRDEGRTVIFISHKLDEVLAIADEITVVRNGRVVATGAARGGEQGRARRDDDRRGSGAADQRPGAAGDPILEIENLTVRNNRGHTGLVSFDLTVRAGEIVGIAGVAGNGQDELTAAIIGLGRIDSGAIRLAREEIAGLSLRERRALGLSYLSPDRAAEASPRSLDRRKRDRRHHRRPGLCAGGV